MKRAPMTDVVLPGGLRIPDPQVRDIPSTDAVFIVQSLAPMLQGLMNQLHLLIQIECGYVKRSDMRERFVSAENVATEAAEETEA